MSCLREPMCHRHTERELIEEDIGAPVTQDLVFVWHRDQAILTVGSCYRHCSGTRETRLHPQASGLPQSDYIRRPRGVTDCADASVRDEQFSKCRGDRRSGSERKYKLTNSSDPFFQKNTNVIDSQGCVISVAHPSPPFHCVPIYIS